MTLILYKIQVNFFENFINDHINFNDMIFYVYLYMSMYLYMSESMY